MLRLISDNTAPAGADGRDRRQLIAKIHVAKKQLAMLDDDYRALLDRVAKVASAKDCSDAQLRAVIAEFVRLGFKGAASHAPRRAPDHGPVAKKARAMWISLGQLGAIDDPSDAALEAFACRQLGVERMAWMDEREGFKLFEALKAIAERAGWDQSTRGRRTASEKLHRIKSNLIGALSAKVLAAGDERANRFQCERSEWTFDELDAAARYLAACLRDARKVRPDA